MAAASAALGSAPTPALSQPAATAPATDPGQSV